VWVLAKVKPLGSGKVRLPVWVKAMPQGLAPAQRRLRLLYRLSHTIPVRVSAQKEQRQREKIQSQQSARGAQASLLYRWSGRSRRGHCTKQWVIWDYGKNLRKKD
jgi:hypothetical protein